MPNVAYRINLVGMEQAIAGLKAVHGSAYSPPSVSESWGKFSSKLDHVSDSAKKVARDMDATGNKVAESSLKAIDNITGLAAAMAAGPFSLVGAIGLVVGGWAAYNSITSRSAEIDREAKTAVDALMASTRALAEQQVSLNESDSKQLKHRQDVVDLTITQNALNLQAMNLNVMGFRMMVEEQRRGLNSLSLSDPTGAKRAGELMQTIDTLKGLEAGYTLAVREQEKLRGEAADVRYRLIGAIAEETDAKRTADAKKNSDERAKHDAEAIERSAAAAIEFDQRDQRMAQAREDAQTERLARGEEEEQKAETERERRVEEALADDQELARQEKKHDNERLDKLREYDQAAKLASQEQREELKRLRDEQMKATAGMIYAQGVNTAYTTSMYAVGKGIGYATSELQQFQDINRDNYRDMLQINENTMAAWAQRLQAFLFTTAMEAGRMALMENAMGLGEVARGTGALFTNPAEAATHFVSAGMHYAASAAYGTFAGGAAVGFGVVAASRGQGGLFASASTDQGGGLSSGGGGGGGPSGGSYGGGGERGSRSPSIVVNINNEPGSMTPEDQDRAAVTTARYVARAQRSWFARQQMGG